MCFDIRQRSLATRTGVIGVSAFPASASGDDVSVFSVVRVDLPRLRFQGRLSALSGIKCDPYVVAYV